MALTYVQVEAPRQSLTVQAADVPLDWDIGTAPGLSITIPDPGRKLSLSPGQLGDSETDALARVFGVWWPISEAERDERVVNLTLAHRGAAGMKALRGPIDASEDVTRPQFADLLWRKSRCANPNDPLYCPAVIPEAHGYKPPPLRGVTIAEDAQTTKARDKQLAPGFKQGVSFKIKQETASAEQKRVLAAALSVADELKAPRKATLALVAALITESAARNLTYGDRDSTGALQVRASTARSYNLDPRNVEQVSRFFLQKGYWKHYPVGAIQKARRDPSATPGEIAQWCQGSGPNAYQTWLPEAQKVLEAWTGVSGGADVDVSEPQAFQLTADEDAWSKWTGIATDSNRYAYATLDAIYWVTGNQIAQSRPLYQFSRRSPGVAKLGPWKLDALRQVDTMPLVLVCSDAQMWGLAGHTVQIVGEGDGDGVWIVTKFSRASKNDRHATFELSRLRPFIPESKLRLSSASTAGVVSSSEKSNKLKDAVRFVDSIGRQNFKYLWGGGHGGWSGPYDCSGFCSALEHHTSGTLSKPIATGDFLNFGEPGEGEVVTYWVSADHMYATVNTGSRLRKAEAGGGTDRGATTGWRPASSPIRRPGFKPRHAKGW